MRFFRSVVALLVAGILGLAAARAAQKYLKKPLEKTTAPIKERVVIKKVEVPPPPPATKFSARIPAGQRAISIRVDEVSGVSRRVETGDVVDVIATTEAPANEKGRISRTVLEQVEVYDVPDDDRIAGVAKGGRPSWTVVLLVTPQQAAMLSAAAEASTVHLVVRNTKDDLAGRAKDTLFTSEHGAALLPEAPDVRRYIRPGQRAVTLEIKNTDGICGVLKRGDRVDVLLTCPYSKFATSGESIVGAEGTVTETHMLTKTLLQNVEVLATKEAIGNGPGNAETVTLLLSPEDAVKVTVAADASKKSILRLVCRGAEDQATARVGEQKLIDLLVKPQRVREVRVIRSTDLSIQRFPE